MRKRLIMAWKAFWLIPFDVQLKPFHSLGRIPTSSSIECDNFRRTGCKELQEWALYETRATFTIDDTNSYFLCHKCAAAAEGTKTKLT